MSIYQNWLFAGQFEQSKTGRGMLKEGKHRLGWRLFILMARDLVVWILLVFMFNFILPVFGVNMHDYILLFSVFDQDLSGTFIWGFGLL